MNKKIIAFLAVMMISICVLVLSICGAEGNTVYVRNGGSGDGSSAASPCGSFAAAFEKLDGKGGTVVLTGPTSIGQKLVVPAQAGDLTITAVDTGMIRLGARFQFEKGGSGTTVTIDAPLILAQSYDCFIFGGCNNITFTENFSVTHEKDGRLCFFGGVHAGETESNQDCIVTEPYTITVKNGVFKVFGGGNYRIWSSHISAICTKITVNVSGGVFGIGNVAPEETNKQINGFTVSGMSILCGDAELNISGGIFDTPVYMQGNPGSFSNGSVEQATLLASSPDYYSADGNISVQVTGGTFNGGEFSAYQTTAGFVQLLRGNFDLTIGAAAVFAEGTLIDATQVKAYAGQSQRASVTLPASMQDTVELRRFDLVNGETRSHSEPLRILFIGDSITWGSGASNAAIESYPAQFLALCDAAGRDVIIGDYAVPGTGVLPTANSYYSQTLACKMAYSEFDPDYVFFALGTNDAAVAGGTNGALLNFYNQYKELIASFGDLPDVKRVFVSSAIYRNSTATASNIRAVSVIRPVQKRIAEELAAQDAEKYTWVDMYALTLEEALAGNLLTSDGLHPGDAGYAVMADKVYAAIFDGVYTVNNFEMTDIYVSDSGRLDGTGTVDDPMSSITVAFGKAAPEATIHIDGTVTFSANFCTPFYAEKLTLTGTGENSVLCIGGDSVKFGSDICINNLTLKTTLSSSAISACFNNVELTDSVKTEGPWCFNTGYNVFADQSLAGPKTTTYDTVDSASSDQDCVISLNGGYFYYFLGGNRRYSASAPIGTYSGDMTIHIGSGVTIGQNAMSGICGMNYLTGAITADIDAWQDGIVLRDYAGLYGINDPITFVATNNTGTVTMDIDQGLSPTVRLAGDMNGDNVLSVLDAVSMLQYVLDGFDTQKSANWFDLNTVSLLDVLCILKWLV